MKLKMTVVVHHYIFSHKCVMAGRFFFLYQTMPLTVFFSYSYQFEVGEFYLFLNTVNIAVYDYTVKQPTINIYVKR